MWSGNKIEVLNQGLALEVGRYLVQLLALGDAEDNRNLLSRWVPCFDLVDDGPESIDVVAHVENNCFLSIPYLLKSAWLTGFSDELAKALVKWTLLVSTHDSHDLLGDGVVLLDEGIHLRYGHQFNVLLLSAGFDSL